MAQALATAYPKATLEQNPKGMKPRKGSFEVLLVLPSGSSTLIFSKLDSFGPSKDRAALPDPSTFPQRLVDFFTSSSSSSSDQVAGETTDVKDDTDEGEIKEQESASEIASRPKAKAKSKKTITAPEAMEPPRETRSSRK